MAEWTMDEPVGETRLDNSVQGLLGKPLDRIEGRLKVSGTAAYTLDEPVEGRLAHAYAICAPVGHGRVAGFDVEAAREMPGVIDVIVEDERIARETGGFFDGWMMQGNGVIDHYGQSLGLVVAETFEQARAAAHAVTVRTEEAEGRYDADRLAHEAEPVPADARLPDATVGDLDAGMAQGVHSVDAVYSTPSMVHAAMEPHAAIAEWKGKDLVVHTSAQLLEIARQMLADALKIDADRVRVVSRYVGGGFGGKGGIGVEGVLAAIAAERTGRPVRLAMTRRQLFHIVYRRSETRQRLRLACDASGRLTAIGQDSIVSQRPERSNFEPVALGSLALYAGANRRFTTKLLTLDLPETGPVRAPGEAVGMLGLECAMDELAEKAGIDPVEFRRINEPDRDLTRDRPFSARALIECLDEGARRFGWEKRKAKPASTREGDWLIGHGVASAIRVNLLAKASAALRIDRTGEITVESSMTDIGTGSYTILAQIAAESLGVPMDRVAVKLGDTAYPNGFGSGGSMGAASAGSAVALAAEDAVKELARRMGVPAAEMTLKDGYAIAANRRVAIADLVSDEPIEASGTIQPGTMSKTYDQAAYGGHFVEVAVNAVTGETRVRRVTSVFAAGRILNAKTARSQMIGGIIWGIGNALMEDAVTDARTGQFVNNDLAEYHVPVNADIPHLDVSFLDEEDDKTNPLKIKGIGELGISGVGAAVNNAVYNATGIRVRSFPVTLDKLIAGLPG
ncbi:xanthine dehydrogenase family protein molybdopterin-binding subunit [Fulvimarina endophytica]|uniref:Xanthine dehydrogenase family protein molybdopterin-binding subunit n=1 Tax=Fulvimarina endophytica TaxID=2293836 RepID=A0A371X1T6_9HYPH|nr:xanthine dehydrogenase family protein molybdopterin-binding subunit [Fulvimarina endophytica]RFC63182.1 xanthine dehydrogenase family protein molybdopterin-binding subunit [Fulvimarina endophytica]